MFLDEWYLSSFKVICFYLTHQDRCTNVPVKGGQGVIRRNTSRSEDPRFPPVL